MEPPCQPLLEDSVICGDDFKGLSYLSDLEARTAAGALGLQVHVTLKMQAGQAPLLSPRTHRNHCPVLGESRQTLQQL